MIGRLTGILAEKVPPNVLLDVQGVGYEVQVSMNTFYRLPELKQIISLYTHFVVREDAQLLFGFYEEKERRLFRALIKISGVGPKLGLTILSGIATADFVRVVHNNDVAALEQLPGIGKKTAERLIIEMRDKLDDWKSETEDTALEGGAERLSHSVAADEAESALVALGYKEKEAKRAVSRIDSADMSSQDIIREALKRMVNI